MGFKLNGLALYALVWSGALFAQPAGSIEGRVLSSTNDAPLRKVMVKLTSSSANLVAATDGDGRFRFKSLPAGAYRLTASHAGFADRAARRAVLLGERDHATGIEIRLTPYGSVSGRIFDADGDPLEGVQVALFKRTHSDGRARYQQADTQTTIITNNLGEYRIAHLTPGHYLVQAEMVREQVNDTYGEVPNTMYIPSYHPNASTKSAASPVEVGAGADLRDIDISLVKTRLFRVHGRITGVSSQSEGSVFVEVRPADGGPEYGTLTGTGSPDYGFDVPVPAGLYEISAMQNFSEAFGTASVTVSEDVTGVVVTMSPAPEVTGRITLSESVSGVNLEGVRADLVKPDRDHNGPAVLSDSTGRLVFAKPLPPGRYSLDVDLASLPSGCYIKSVKIGGREVPPDEIDIQTTSEIDIVLSNQAGTITGSVSDADGKPFPDARVTIMPADESSRPAIRSAGDDGKFKFTALRPGKYRLYAWEEMDDDSWQDPDFRKKYNDRATEVVVGPSLTQSAQLQPIDTSR